AAPERGRFRDYVKSALINLVNDHHRARQAKPRHLASGSGEPAAPAEVSLPSDQDFMTGWRTELLNPTRAALVEVNPAYHAAEPPRPLNPTDSDPVRSKSPLPQTCPCSWASTPRAWTLASAMMLDT